MTEASDDEAVVISDCTARDPEVRVASVKFRVELFQTSATRVPKEVSVRLVLVQIEVARVVVETTVAPTTNDLSIFTRSPFGTLPQDIVEGHTPSGPADGIE